MKKIRFQFTNTAILYPVDTIRAVCREKRGNVRSDCNSLTLAGPDRDDHRYFNGQLIHGERVLLDQASAIGQARAAA